MPFRAFFILLGLTTLWVTLCTQQNHMSVNPASRYATMEALVEHGTYRVDDTLLGGRTVDKVQWEGAFYSSKPPLLPTLCAPVYATLRAITGVGFREATYPTVRAMRLFVAALPWLVAMLLFVALARRCVGDDATAYGLAGAMVVGGLPTAYATHLDNHSFAFLALLAGALAIAPLFRDDGHLPLANAALAGLCGGAATTFDLGATPIVGAFGVFIVWRLRHDRAAAATFIATGLFAPALQMWIQYQMIGDVRPFYLHRSAYQYEGSYWGNPIEFDALSEPWYVYAFHSLFGHHGVFSVTPWLLLGLPWLFQKERTPNAESLRRVAAFATLFVVGYYVHKTNNYGGRCVGMRWFMVLHPILAVGALRTVERYDLLRRRPIWVGVLVGASAVSALSGAVNPWEEGFVFALFRAVGLGSVAG